MVRTELQDLLGRPAVLVSDPVLGLRSESGETEDEYTAYLLTRQGRAPLQAVFLAVAQRLYAEGKVTLERLESELEGNFVYTLAHLEPEDELTELRVIAHAYWNPHGFEKAARHARVPVEFQRYLLSEKWERALEGLTRNPAADEQVLVEIARMATWDLTFTMTRNPAIPEQALVVLAQNADDRALLPLPERELPLSVYRALIARGSKVLTMKIALSEVSPTAVLEDLKQSQLLDVRQAATQTLERIEARAGLGV